MTINLNQVTGEDCSVFNVEVVLLSIMSYLRMCSA